MDLVFKRGALPRKDTNLQLILFLGQGPKIYKAKTRSCAKDLRKGLFYIRAMETHMNATSEIFYPIMAYVHSNSIDPLILPYYYIAFLPTMTTN